MEVGQRGVVDPEKRMPFNPLFTNSILVISIYRVIIVFKDQ